MSFKRRRPKNQRAGCLMCKCHKANGAKDKDKPSIIRLSDRDFDRVLQAIEEAPKPNEALVAAFRKWRK